MKIKDFFSYSYQEMAYMRWWRQELQTKKFKLYYWDKLLPTSNYILAYQNVIPEVKEYYNDYITRNYINQGILEVEYNWNPSEEQFDILKKILVLKNDYYYYCWLIVAKTWSWKSHIISQLIWIYKIPTLVSVHNIKTLWEMKKKLEETLSWKIKIWVYYWEKKEMWDIIITTHTSLSKEKWVLTIKWEKFKPWMLLYDEADRNISSKMIEAFCNSWVTIMYWLTWTPQSKILKEDWMNLIFWKTIQSNLWWYKVTPVVKYIRYKTNKEYLFTNYHEMRGCLIDDEDRTKEQIKYIKHVMKYRQCWLLLSDRRTEVERYYEELKDNWFEVILIHWDTKEQDDVRLINETVYSWKKTLIIWTSWKMSRWVDIPNIDTVFLFYPNKFESATIQAVWRWLRKFEWKENTLLIDWCDYPIMKNQMYSRFKTYRKEYGIEIWKSNEAKSID